MFNERRFSVKFFILIFREAHLRPFQTYLIFESCIWNSQYKLLIFYRPFSNVFAITKLNLQVLEEEGRKLNVYFSLHNVK